MELYLDANFLVFAFIGTGEKGENAKAILAGILEGRHRAFTSPLAFDEAMWALIKERRSQVMEKMFLSIFSIKNLTVLPVSPETPLSAAEIMKGGKLKPRDAFHLAIMKENRIQNIASDDGGFDGITGIKRIALAKK